MTCLQRMLDLLACSPKQRQASSPLLNMAIGILYKMSTGYAMQVHYDDRTGLVISADASRPANAAITTAAADIRSETVEFLRPHLFLRQRLPDNDYAMSHGVVTGSVTVQCLVNHVTSCFSSLLSEPKCTIQQLRDKCLSRLVPPSFLYANDVSINSNRVNCCLVST